MLRIFVGALEKHLSQILFLQGAHFGFEAAPKPSSMKNNKTWRLCAGSNLHFKKSTTVSKQSYVKILSGSKGVQSISYWQDQRVTEIESKTLVSKSSNRETSEHVEESEDTYYDALKKIETEAKAADQNITNITAEVGKESIDKMVRRSGRIPDKEFSKFEAAAEPENPEELEANNQHCTNSFIELGTPTTTLVGSNHSTNGGARH